MYFYIQEKKNRIPLIYHPRLHMKIPYILSYIHLSTNILIPVGYHTNNAVHAFSTESRCHTDLSSHVNSVPRQNPTRNAHAFPEVSNFPKAKAQKSMERPKFASSYPNNPDVNQFGNSAFVAVKFPPPPPRKAYVKYRRKNADIFFIII